MKNFTILFLILVSSISLGGEKTTFRSKSGSYQGSAYTSGNKTVYRNSSGHYYGSTYSSGKKTSFYDSNGRYSGSLNGKFTPANPFGGK